MTTQTGRVDAPDNRVKAAPDAGSNSAAPHSGGVSHASRISAFMLRYATVIFAVCLLITTSIIYPRFWNIDNLANILSQNAPIGIVAVGMTVVIVAGGFDLSAGAVYAAAGVVFASLANDLSLIAAFIGALLIGAVAGLINGFIATKLQVNSLIATIGTGAAFSGLTYLYCSSQPVVADVEGFDVLGLGRLHGVPWSALLLVAVFLVAGVTMNNTVFGRWIYAVGGNAEAARVSGLRVGLIKLSAFVIVGVCAALAGLLSASQLGVGQPTVGGSIALDAFTIVVIGGTSIYGGQGALCARESAC